MIKLSRGEVTIALAAFDREPFNERMASAISLLRGASSGTTSIELYPETAQTLRNAIESGIAEGIWTKTELPEVRAFVVHKLMVGFRATSAAVTGIAKAKTKTAQTPQKIAVRTDVPCKPISRNRF